MDHGGAAPDSLFPAEQTMRRKSAPVWLGHALAIVVGAGLLSALPSMLLSP